MESQKDKLLRLWKARQEAEGHDVSGVTTLEQAKHFFDKKEAPKLPEVPEIPEIPEVPEEPAAVTEEPVAPEAHAKAPATEPEKKPKKKASKKAKEV